MLVEHEVLVELLGRVEALDVRVRVHRDEERTAVGVDVLRVEALLEDVEARVRVDDGDLRTERAESVGA